MTQFLKIRRLASLGVLAALGAAALELRPGVWASRDVSALPLPVSGYDLYMIGELHGVRENEAVLIAYLTKLYAEAGLRDVALEEQPAYRREAQAYVAGESKSLPERLCLRAGIFDALRRFNEGRSGSGLVQVHLVDIDLNANAIRDHLLALKQQIPGSDAARVPAAGEIKAQGEATVATLERLTSDAAMRAELRTVRHSIRAHQQGLDGSTGPVKGSPYLDDREDAIVSNLTELLHSRQGRPVLALYGSDHVSKNVLHNGGPSQDKDFPPAALRMERAGIKVFSMVTLPLTGRSNWRGREGELMWTASDGSLASGETLDRVLASSAETAFLYIDPKREKVRLPSQDLTRSGADAFLLFARGTASENRCAAR
jgi:hypothetical protein